MLVYKLRYRLTNHIWLLNHSYKCTSGDFKLTSPQTYQYLPIYFWLTWGFSAFSNQPGKSRERFPSLLESWKLRIPGPPTEVGWTTLGLSLPPWIQVRLGFASGSEVFLYSSTSRTQVLLRRPPAVVHDIFHVCDLVKGHSVSAQPTTLPSEDATLCHCNPRVNTAQTYKRFSPFHQYLTITR